MRILHISSLYPPFAVGGAEKVVEMLAEAQAARGHAVGVAYLTQTAEPPGIRHGVEVLPQASRNMLWINQVFAAPRPLRTANKLVQLGNWRTAADFGRAITAFAPDIVHTHSMVELPPMIWAEIARHGARSVHTLHDYDLLCSRASLFRNGRSCDIRHTACRVTSAWKQRFAARIDAVAAVSAPVLAEHRRFGLFPNLAEDRARVIWNAANVPPAHRPPAREGAFVFGFLGRLVPEKGIETLIDACRLLPDGGWRLLVAGHAQEGDAALRARAGTLPIEFQGFVPAGPFLDSIDVLVVPAIWREPFGLTVVEAFARGVPVLGSRLGAIEELVGTIGDEWLVPPADPVALARRMAAAIAAGRAALPKADAFAPVLAAVTPGRMIDGYDALYATALAA